MMNVLFPALLPIIKSLELISLIIGLIIAAKVVLVLVGRMVDDLKLLLMMSMIVKVLIIIKYVKVFDL